MNLTKKTISKIIYKETELNLAEATNLVESFLRTLKDNVFKKTIKIHNFGTFEKKITPRRLGRNPKTKELHEIKPMNKIFFKPSNKVKKNIN